MKKTADKKKCTRNLSPTANVKKDSIDLYFAKKQISKEECYPLDVKYSYSEKIICK